MEGFSYKYGKKYLLPKTEGVLEVKEIGSSHNPLRAFKVNGVEVDWEIIHGNRDFDPSTLMSTVDYLNSYVFYFNLSERLLVWQLLYREN